MLLTRIAMYMLRSLMVGALFWNLVNATILN